MFSIYLTLLSLITLAKVAPDQAFAASLDLEPATTSPKVSNYQFVLSGNQIDLSLWQVVRPNLVLTPSSVPSPSPTSTLTSTATPNSTPTPTLTSTLTPTPTPPLPDRYLSFTYRLRQPSQIDTLPADLPLFIVALGEQVLYSADVAMADDVPHQVELDLDAFSLTAAQLQQMPVFYQNSFLSGLQLSVEQVDFSSQANLPTQVNQLSISDLSAIRELDQSLTVIFTQNEQFRSPHAYELLCLGVNQAVLSTAKLHKADDFIWQNFLFARLWANRKSELVFHLPSDEFACNSQVVVTVDGVRSEAVSIISVKELTL